MKFHDVVFTRGESVERKVELFVETRAADNRVKLHIVVVGRRNIEFGCRRSFGNRVAVRLIKPDFFAVVDDFLRCFDAAFFGGQHAFGRQETARFRKADAAVNCGAVVHRLLSFDDVAASGRFNGESKRARNERFADFPGYRISKRFRKAAVAPVKAQKFVRRDVAVARGKRKRKNRRNNYR